MLADGPLFIIEGEERQLPRWDFVHCPPGTRHTFVGAGRGPSVVLANARASTSTRTATAGRTPPTRSAAVTAPRSTEDTTDASDSYARFGRTAPARYQEGWLPG